MSILNTDRSKAVTDSASPNAAFRPGFTTRDITAAALLAALTAASAIISVPIPGSGIPFSMQVFVVLLAGAVAGPKVAASAMVAYLAIGAAGAPVFAMMRSGPAVLLGPSGGYLASFPVAAAAVGMIVGRRSPLSMGRSLLGMAIGLALIYAGGAARLLWLTGKPLGAVVQIGVLPFLPLDLLKTLAAAHVAVRLRTRFANPSTSSK